MRRLRHAESHGPPPAPREFVSGESVLYLGRHYRLKVRPDATGATGAATLRGGWLHVPAPAGAPQAAHVRTALVAWFRRHAAERLPERVGAWRAKAGVPPPRAVVAEQRKRWGSCDHRGTIRLNWRIVQAPMRLVDDGLDRPRARRSQVIEHLSVAAFMAWRRAAPSTSKRAPAIDIKTRIEPA